MTSCIKSFSKYIRRHDISRSFENVKLPLVYKWQLIRSLQSKGMQRLTFSSMGHFSLSQWFRTSSLNAPVLPTVLCWILAIVVASFTISIIPTGGGTQFDAGWGPVPGPEEKWLCLCGMEGKELFFRFMLLVVLAVRRTNERRRKWKLCGTCFQYPQIKRGKVWFWKVLSKSSYGLSMSFLTCQSVPFPFSSYRSNGNGFVQFSNWKLEWKCLIDVKLLNVCKST